MSWATRRTDVFVIENGGETTYGLEAADGQGRFLETDDLATLIADSEHVLIYCKGRCASETISVLPGYTVTNSYGNFYSYFVQRPADEVVTPAGKSGWSE